MVTVSYSKTPYLKIVAQHLEYNIIKTFWKNVKNSADQKISIKTGSQWHYIFHFHRSSNESDKTCIKIALH